MPKIRKITEITAIQEICTEYGLERADLASRFGIPIRTVQQWYAGDRTPPEYVVQMMRTILEIERKSSSGFPEETKALISKANQKYWDAIRETASRRFGEPKE